MAGGFNIGGFRLGKTLFPYVGAAISFIRDGLVLAFTRGFDSSNTTLNDTSPEDNDATLYTGRYITTDGGTDRGIVADCSAAGAGSYYLTGKVKPNAVTTAELTMDGSTDSGLTGLSANVWQDFTTATASVTPSAVQVGFDGTTASAADWSDVRLIDASDGSTVARWQLTESADGDLDGYPALDSSGNGYHGTHTGCAGGTGETTIPQTAGMDWNKRMWFDGVDEVSLGALASFTSYTEIEVTVSFLATSGTGRIISILHSASDDIRIYFDVSGNLKCGVDDGTAYDVSFGTGYDDGEMHTVVLTLNGSGLSATVDGGNTQTDGSASFDFSTASGAAKIGNAAFGVSVFFEGIIYNASIANQSGVQHSYTGYGNTDADWKDQTASNDGTVNGSPSNYLVPESLTTSGEDALGNAIADPRVNNYQLNFFGDGEYAEAADSNSLDVTTEATWELWGNFYETVSSNSGYFARYDFNSNERAWRIGKQTTSAIDDLYVFISSDGAVNSGTSIVGILSDELQHVVITYNAGTILTYINGVLAATDSNLQTSIHAASAPVQIATNGPTTPNVFTDRKIGSAKIYNTALTADEVLRNYNAQKSIYGL